MNILITGITGFIGKNLYMKLKDDKNVKLFAVIREKSEESFRVDYDCEYYIDNGDTEDLVSYIKSKEIDGIVHLASCYLKEHRHNDISNLISSNVSFSTRLLEAGSSTRVKWFINTGTFWQHYRNQKYSPVNLYAATKEAFRTVAKYYIETTDIKFVTIMLNDTYGPGDTRRKIMNIWKSISETNESLDMSGGEQLIDIVHISDVIQAYLLLIDKLNNEENNIGDDTEFAVSSGNPITLKKLAQIFMEVVGHKISINWDKYPYREREVMIPWESGKSVPDWKPKMNLINGIKDLFK